MNLFFQVTGLDQDVRIDKYLSEHCEQISRSYLQKLLKTEAVLVNGKPVKASYKVCGEDIITCKIPAAVEAEIAAEPMMLDIIYEDEDLLFVNKPKGMVVHPAAGHLSGTLVNGLMYHCKDGLSGINGVMRPGIVHRIDMDTTGILVVCKNDFAHQGVAAQLKEHSVTRKYFAVVEGVINEEHGTVNAPIGRHPTDRKKMSTKAKAGKEAVTHYHVLERFNAFTYIECQLETGRTHQIRVHMAALGHPLLGDLVYGKSSRQFPKLEGQTLHAGILGLIHPRTGKYMEFSAPLPEYFQLILEKLRKNG